MSLIEIEKLGFPNIARREKRRTVFVMQTILAQSKFYEQGKNIIGAEFGFRTQIIELIRKEITNK